MEFGEEGISDTSDGGLAEGGEEEARVGGATSASAERRQQRAVLQIQPPHASLSVGRVISVDHRVIVRRLLSNH